ncbi:MAG: dTDP-glucose 4,6-dehydratase [Acidobacteriota bacterium]|nr:dTDP-glucose 4,6-dehydratase [Acidobacteriota bacterium]MDQ7087096.1 dTDP-glucose 4,6-dehydratase [Acidobacteriota bacterium]
MQTWIVTGGAGFIGSNFVRLALDRTSARIVVYDKLTYAGSLESLADVREDPRFLFVHGDIADRQAVGRLLDEHRPDVLVNFAAESHVDRSIDDPGTFIETNIRGTWTLLEESRRMLAAREAKAREAFRFLQVSTDEVYGSLGEEGAFSETTPYAPNSPYAASKAAADHIARSYQRTFGMGVVITNCSNNYGPFQFPEKLIPLMILNALEGRPLPIYGDGGNVRDWLYVEDHCEGLLRVIEGGRPGEKYNLGGGCELTNLELVDRLCAILDELRPPADNPRMRDRGSNSYADLKTFVADRPGHDRRYAIDATKIRRELGWTPRHDFEAGLRRTVEWYLEHRSWCQAVQENNYDRQRLGLDHGAVRH